MEKSCKMTSFKIRREFFFFKIRILVKGPKRPRLIMNRLLTKQYEQTFFFFSLLKLMFKTPKFSFNVDES